MKLTIPDFDANITNRKIGKQLSAYFKDLAGVYREKDTPAARDILPHMIEISEQLARDAEPEKADEPKSEALKTDRRTQAASNDEPFVVPN